MGSKDAQTRQLQKKRYEGMLEKRRSLLSERTVPLHKQLKDRGVKRLQARIQQLNRALISIQTMKTTLEKAAMAKQKNAELKKATSAQAKKERAEPAPAKETAKEKKKKAQKQ